MFQTQGFNSFPFYNLVDYQAHGNSFKVSSLEKEIVGEDLINEALSFDREVNTYANLHRYSVLEPNFLEHTFSLLSSSYYYALLKEAYYDYQGEWKGYKDHKLYFELCLTQIWYVLNWRERLSFPIELVIKYKLK
jgi:hypothetical protein